MAKRSKKNQLREEMQQRRRRVLHRLGLGVFVLLITAGAMAAYHKLADENTLPIRSVQINGTFRYLQTDELRAVLANSVNGNFFSIDINAVRQAIQQIAWVDGVSVRKKWPDMLVLDIQEHRPLARWADGGYVNARGQHFPATEQASLQGLAVLDGPQGTVAMLAKGYVRFRELLQPAQLRITRLEVSHRRAWKLSLTQGLRISLGRANTSERLQRFIKVYEPYIHQQQSRIESVDMRYTNGFAVRWKPEENLPEKAEEVQKNV